MLNISEPDFLKHYKNEDTSLPFLKDASLGLKYRPRHLDYPIDGRSFLALTNHQESISTPDLQISPCGNCGIMLYAHPCTISWMPLDLGTWWLTCIEAFCRYYNKSVIICNDGVSGDSWDTITKYGKDWNFLSLGYNRNYDSAMDKHRVGLMYKNIGDFAYKNEYNFFCNIKEFYGLPEDYDRG